MRKDLPPAQFRYDGKHLVPEPATDPDLVDKGLAHANWSTIAYEE